MSRAGSAALVLVAALATGAGGYWAGRNGVSVPAELAPYLPAGWGGVAEPPAAPTRPATGPIVYYRDPNGRPLYSPEPKATADGRPWIAVHANEDVRFDDEDSAEAPAPSTSAATTGKRVLYYQNPMGLPDTSPVPRKDSMGMDYIPVHEGEGEDASTITLSPGKLQRTGVRSEPVERRTLTVSVRAPATIEQDERRVAVVAVRTDSFVEKVENVTTGDRVRKGQPLLRLYSPEISAAAAQYLSAIGYDGARRRLENLAVPPEVIAEIERTRKVPLTIQWPAPRDGIVIERSVTDGMRATAGDVLFRIADHSVVWVVADVTERELAQIAEGQSASVRVRGMPGQAFAGKVARIYPHLTKETRTAKVRIELPNPEGALRPDMYADVEFATGTQAPVLAVPNSAVIDTGTRQLVILDKGDGRFEPKDVKVGARSDGFSEIRDGIAEGDRVVVSANFLIDAESNLRAALQGMGEAKP